jgi:hypothetical protein
VKRRRFLIILLVSLPIFALSIFWVPDLEPQYNGLSLGSWVLLCKDRMNPAPQDAIRHIGTNALPFLVRWVAYEPPAWKTRLSKATKKLPKVLTGSRVFKWLTAENELANALPDGATEAFGILGREAIPAVKQLARIHANPKTPGAAYRAWIAMALIGKSIPDSPEWVEERVHKLISDLGYPSVVEKVTAIGSLGEYGPRAREAVPSLVYFLNDSWYPVREATTNALLKIAPEALAQFGQTNLFRVAANRPP